MSTEDILYSPIRRQSEGRVFENFTAAPSTSNPAPFADTPGPDARQLAQSAVSASPEQMLKEKAEDAHRRCEWEKYQQALVEYQRAMQQQSLQNAVNQQTNQSNQIMQGPSLQQQFEQALQNPSFQQTVQPQYGLGYQNLYANTTVGTSSSGLNQSNCLGSYNGLFGSTAASNSLAAYHGISAATKCPVTGRNTITEAQATAKIASFL